MEKEEFRAVPSWMKFTGTLRDTAPTLKTVYFWINEFKHSRTSKKDEAYPGRPVEATAPEMI